MTSSSPAFERKQAGVLRARLAEPRRFIQVVAGPRQVGKTTLVQSVVQRWDEDTRHRVPLKVVLLGSAPLLIAPGLSGLTRRAPSAGRMRHPSGPA